MKKVVIIIMALALALSFTGCKAVDKAIEKAVINECEFVSDDVMLVHATTDVKGQTVDMDVVIMPEEHELDGIGVTEDGDYVVLLWADGSVTLLEEVVTTTTSNDRINTIRK